MEVGGYQQLTHSEEHDNYYWSLSGMRTKGTCR